MPKYRRKGEYYDILRLLVVVVGEGLLPDEKQLPLLERILTPVAVL